MTEGAFVIAPKTYTTDINERRILADALKIFIRHQRSALRKVKAGDIAADRAADKIARAEDLLCVFDDKVDQILPR